MDVVQKATFDVRSMIPGYTSPPTDIMAEAYWGGIPSGTQVHPTVVAQDAQTRFLKHREANHSFEYMPLASPFPDEFVQKAIFELGRNPRMSQEVYERQCEPLMKAWVAGLAKDDPEIQKAMTTGSSLMHIIADEAVTLLYKRPYPIQALIPVEANKGKAANWDVIPPFGFNSAAFGKEDPSLTETEIDPYNRTDYIKYMYAVGRITQGAKFAGLTQYPARDLKTIQIDASQEALRALRERSILGVTRDVSNIDSLGFEAASDIQYKGMYEIITGNTGTPNWIDGASFDTYHEIMDGMRESYKLMVKDAMRPNLAICDYTTFNTIAAGLMEYFRTDPIREFTQGISKISLVFPGNGGLPLVPTEFLPMDSGQGAVYMIDTRLWARRVLWQDMYQDLANLNTSDKFVISAAEVLIDKSDKDGSSSLHGGVFGLN